MKITKYIIFPDIHGRKFWKPIYEKFEGDSNIAFIFLGDYLDHYDLDKQELVMGISRKDYPWLFEDFTQKEVINNFKEIIESKREQDVLLIGNHDLHYLPPLDKEWGCRRYNSRKWKIRDIFLHNLDKFKIAHIVKNNKGKDYLFTHAGFLKNWVKQAKMFYDYDVTPENVNDLLKNQPGRRILGMIGYERGSRDPRDSGSCLWADVWEHINSYNRYDEYYQIFGHTCTFPEYLQYDINEEWAMLDSNKAFELDIETGELKEIIMEDFGIPYYTGDVKPDKNTIFVFGSNPEGRHGLGAAKVAREEFGAIYGQPEGLQGNSYAIPTKELRAKITQYNGKMAYGYGNNKYPGVKAETTWEAIINGERTATTRYISDGNIDYWKQVKEFDIISFENASGKKLFVKITKPLTKLDSNTSAEDWCKKEGWSIEYFNDKVLPRIKSGEAYQMEYEFVGMPGNVKTMSPYKIIEAIKKMYEVARSMPNKYFKVAYRNTFEASLNGLTGIEMMNLFKLAGKIPQNVIFSKEWVELKIITEKDYDEFEILV